MQIECPSPGINVVAIEWNKSASSKSSFADADSGLAYLSGGIAVANSHAAFRKSRAAVLDGGLVVANSSPAYVKNNPAFANDRLAVADGRPAFPNSQSANSDWMEVTAVCTVPGIMPPAVSVAVLSLMAVF